MYFYIFVFDFPHCMCFRVVRLKKGPGEFERGKKSFGPEEFAFFKKLKKKKKAEPFFS